MQPVIICHHQDYLDTCTACQYDRDVLMQQEDTLKYNLYKYLRQECKTRLGIRDTRYTLTVEDIMVTYSKYGLSFVGPRKLFASEQGVSLSAHVVVSWEQAKEYLYQRRLALLVDEKLQVREIGKIVYDYWKDIRSES